MDLTPRNKAIATICFTAVVFVTVIKGYPSLAGVALGIVGAILTPDGNGKG